MPVSGCPAGYRGHQYTLLNFLNYFSITPRILRFGPSWHAYCTIDGERENSRLTGNEDFSTDNSESCIMKWDTPAYNDVRFGFEVTMYINNR